MWDRRNAYQQSAAKALDDVRAQLAKAQADRDTVQSEAQRLQQIAEVARATRSEQDRQGADLADRISGLRAQNQELDKQHNAVVSALATDQTKLRDFVQQLDRARGDLSRMTDALGKCRAEGAAAAPTAPLPTTAPVSAEGDSK